MVLASEWIFGMRDTKSDQRIRKNLVKAKTDKSQKDTLCRLCKKADESIQTNHVIEARRPDLVVVDKKRRTCKIIDSAVSGDTRNEEKEKEKTEKYQDLRSE